MPFSTRRLQSPSQPVPCESVAFAFRNAPEFSCEEYAAVLAEHESLLYQVADRLLVELRRDGGHCWWDRDLRSSPVISFISGMHETAAVIRALSDDRPADVVVTSRHDLAVNWNLPVATMRRLLEGPQEHYGAFHVVVITQQAASLRALAVHAEDDRDPQTRLRLYLPEEETCVAPFPLRRRRIGSYVFTVFKTPWSLLRLDITRAPQWAAPPQEQIDWLFAEYTPRVVRWLWECFLSADRGVKLMMSVLCGSDANALEDAVGSIRVKRDGTVMAMVMNRTFLAEFSSGYRRIPAELAKAPPPGWLPVFVQTRNWGGIRWLRIAASPRGEVPQPVTERRMVELRVL